MAWQEKENALCATFQFENFKVAFAFMTEVAEIAEQQNHHPDWTNVYNTVSFKLNTHDAGGQVTDKDKKLALAIDSIFEKFSSKNKDK